MDNLIEIIIVLVFLLAGGLQSISKAIQENKKKNDTPKSVPPPVKPTPVNQNQPVSPRPIPAHEPVYPSYNSQMEPPIQRADSTYSPIFQEELSEPVIPQRNESPLTRMLKELLDVPEPEIVTPIPEKPKKKLKKKKIHEKITSPPAIKPSPVQATKPKPCPSVSPLTAITREAGKNPLRTGFILAEILSPPRALRPFSPRRGKHT